MVINGGFVDRVFDHLGAGVGDLILRNVTVTAATGRSGPGSTAARFAPERSGRAEGVTFGNSSVRTGRDRGRKQGQFRSRQPDLPRENSAPDSGGGI